MNVIFNEIKPRIGEPKSFTWQRGFGFNLNQV
jgi:hypothetical protein